MARAIVLALLAVVLAGCGFQLRGATSADPAVSPMRIESVQPGSPLLPPLRRALGNAGVMVVEANAPYATELRIVAEESRERIIALSPQGRPREVELTYRVAFELVGGDEVLLPLRDVEMTREYTVHERDVLGKSHEAEALRDALLRDMVSSLVRYVATAAPQ